MSALTTLRHELGLYYDSYRLDRLGEAGWQAFPPENLRIRHEIIAAMDDWDAANSGAHPTLVKARLHEEMAERFVPVIFPHSPFFFEMGLRVAENWGNPSQPEYTVGGWMHHRRTMAAPASRQMAIVQAGQSLCQPEGAPRLWNIWGPFDNDHHCLGYTKLLTVGINGILAEIAARRTQPCTADEAATLEAMARSARAVLRIAEKFSDAARTMLDAETDPDARRCLLLIADTARRVPAEPPRTFYEGLAMLWFLREVTATVEAIGVSVLGHLDRLLIDLYRADLAAGRLTEAEASDLLARWMLPTDIKFHVDDNSWPETSTCIELGGCDATGAVVWNELTRLIMKTHHAHRLLNPKLNCRISAQAPQEYLDLISATVLAGHNQIALLNDDVLIPACVRAGKTEQEARLYVNGGCQETIVEGVEHSAGAYFYFNMPRVLDLCLQPYDIDASPLPVPQEAIPALPQPVAADSFDDLYRQFMAALQGVIRLGADAVREAGTRHWQHHPCPFFSSTLAGCIEHGMDYTRGGAKYNPSGIALCGLATVVDSLYAVRRAVYDDGWLTLAELSCALQANWQGYEELRARLRRLPKYGQGHSDVDALAAMFARDLGAFIATVPNERGGAYQGTFFVYYAFQWFAEHVRATPDGRAAGDLLSQGVAPHRATAAGSISEVLHSLAAIDFRDYPGNAVLDLQLPAGQGLSPAALSALMRTFAAMGGPTLQPNVVSVERLREAQLHPDQHRDLVVRISGLSAHFVCLQPIVQQEILERTLVTV